MVRSVVVLALGLCAAAAHLAAAQSTAVRVPTGLRKMPRARVPVPPQGFPGQAVGSKSISRDRLDVLLGKSETSIRVVRASGVSDLAAAAPSVGVGPGDFVFRKMADTARRVSAAGSVRPATPTSRDAAPYVMPYRWLTIDSAGVERVLVPFFILTSGGLTYNVASRTYQGVALVGVEDTLHASAGAVTLPRPLKLLLTTTSGGTVTPLQLAIGHTSLDYDSVSIESPDSTNVRIRTGADPAGIVIPIPVRSMSVALIPQQSTLQGLGLATTDIAVSLPRGIAGRDTATITFSSTANPVSPSSVRVNGAQGSTVHLRSGLPGRDSIRAYLDGVLVGETVVTFAPPWVFAGATVAGLVLGGFARFFGAKRRKRARALGRDILKGSPFGVFAAIAGAVGFDMMHLKLDDPAALPAIVVTAGLGAWLGSRLLDNATGSPKPPA